MHIIKVVKPLYISITKNDELNKKFGILLDTDDGVLV